jgi:hypothetical protein
MGHTLVPVRRGLFEARWLFTAGLTGYRETMLHAQQDRGPDEEPSRLSQQAMDDPAHDASFPEHPLTLARAARSWHAHGRLRVTEPPPRSQSGSRTIEALGCAITPPPRFVFSDVRSDDDQTTAVFTRVAFAGTDGVEHLFVTRTSDRIRGLAVASRLVRKPTAWLVITMRADLRRVGHPSPAEIFDYPPQGRAERIEIARP